MLLLNQDIIKKKQINENKITKLDVGKDSGEYKVKTIKNSKIYLKKSTNYLLELYYLFF